jgi:Fe2+ transport system protein FeoA
VILAPKPAHKLETNETSRIIRFDDSIIAGKLMSMGILPQAQIELVRRNALGQTLVYRINSRFKIVLRKDEAMTIIVDTV